MCAKSQLAAERPTTKFSRNLICSMQLVNYSSVAKFASGTVSVHQQLFHCTALTGRFYNRDVECLLRGTDWIFIRNSGCVFCVDMRTNSDYFPIQH